MEFSVILNTSTQQRVNLNVSAARSAPQPGSNARTRRSAAGAVCGAARRGVPPCLPRPACSETDSPAAVADCERARRRRRSLLTTFTHSAIGAYAAAAAAAQHQVATALPGGYVLVPSALAVACTALLDGAFDAAVPATSHSKTGLRLTKVLSRLA